MNQRSYRYYISFSYQHSTGIGMAATDLVLDQPITNYAQVQTIARHMSNQGYDNLTILGFSLYADLTGGTNG